VPAASAAGAAPGDLDTSFNATGKLTVNFGGDDHATQAAITPDGRIVVVGSTTASGGGDYTVARVNANGTLDKSFSEDGLERLGSQDMSFVVGGASVVDFGGEEAANDMVRQADGKLVIVGSTSAGEGNFAIARLNVDGGLDTSFSGDGKQTVDFGGNDAATGVALRTEGKIIVAGEGGPGKDMAVTRLNSDGSVDTSFSPARGSSTSAVTTTPRASRSNPTARSSLSIHYPPVDGGTVSVSAKGALGNWGAARRSARLKAAKALPVVFLKPRKRHRKH
jgi:uncharacterized delta-60 repeat protein